MARRLAPALVMVVLAAVALTGCGEDEKERFAEDYKPLNDRLLKIGRDLGSSLQNAQGKSDQQLARQFAAFALRLQALNKGVRALDTPGDLKDERSELASRIDATVEDLEHISGAAADGDPQAAAAATVELGTSSQALNRAQNQLAKATGAERGSS